MPLKMLWFGLTASGRATGEAAEKALQLVVALTELNPERVMCGPSFLLGLF